jgi:hypothetical protein
MPPERDSPIDLQSHKVVAVSVWSTYFRRPNHFSNSPIRKSRMLWDATNCKVDSGTFDIEFRRNRPSLSTKRRKLLGVVGFHKSNISRAMASLTQAQNKHWMLPHGTIGSAIRKMPASCGETNSPKKLRPPKKRQISNSGCCCESTASGGLASQSRHVVKCGLLKIYERRSLRFETERFVQGQQISSNPTPNISKTWTVDCSW